MVGIEGRGYSPFREKFDVGEPGRNSSGEESPLPPHRGSDEEVEVNAEQKPRRERRIGTPERMRKQGKETTTAQTQQSVETRRSLPPLVGVGQSDEPGIRKGRVLGGFVFGNLP